MRRFAAESVQLSWLRAFIAVTESGTFTAAASDIHRAQSRVSAQVAQLESVLGVQLLIRGRTHVQLTAAGSEFLPYAQAALLQLEAGADVVTAYSGEIRGRLTVKSFPGAAAFVIAPLIRRLSELYPQASIILKEGGADPITDVARNNVDFSMLPSPPGVDLRLPGSIIAVPLFLEPIMCAVPDDHPAAGRDHIGPGLLDSSTVIMTGYRANGIGEYSPLLDAAGVHPTETYIVGQPTTATALVDAGAGIALLPSLAAHMLNTNDRVKLIRVDDERFVRTVSVLMNRNRHYPPIAEKFLDELRSLEPGPWIQRLPDA